MRGSVAGTVMIMTTRATILWKAAATAYAVTPPVVAGRRAAATTTARYLATEIDNEGRMIRNRNVSIDPEDDDDKDGWENFNPVEQQQQRTREPRTPAGGRGTNDSEEVGWDGKPVMKRRTNDNKAPKQRRFDRAKRGNDRYGGGGKFRRNDDGGGGRDGGRRFDNRGRPPPHWEQQKEAEERRINMRALEQAGFEHLYGLASVLHALEANRRDFARPEDRIDIDELLGEDLEHELKQRARKPEAQFSPWLFVQQLQQQQPGKGGGPASAGRQQPLRAKASAGRSWVLRLAEERGIPVATVDKGVLNTLSGNRPHQGYVLRCGKLFFQSLSTLPLPSSSDSREPNFWLVLDEVVDPQNFGALLRSAHFLSNRVGVLVCSKNSAPPSATVSAASAGALELMLDSIYETSNLPRTLAAAEQVGFRVVGAAAEAPVPDVPIYDLQDLPVSADAAVPTVLVLGSEGHGLRHLVSTSCTEFVRVPSGQSRDDGSDASGVDSLNVSVTGGILLWHFLQPPKRPE
jgi:21S rRNA (GM2251-2'-O)-methyltransferase